MTCKGSPPTTHDELVASFEHAGRLPFAFVPHTDDEAKTSAESERTTGLPIWACCESSPSTCSSERRP